MDGIEVLQRIKQDERLRMIPVVMMTSSEEEPDLVESYRYGVNSYVVKPVSPDDFAESVTKLGFYWMVMNKEPRNT